ncbi:MAG TPA: IS481 family transposase [Mycobacteriales bacterium]|nr:IS481 family transposase [Mycobacteriales bacterium]
MSKARVIVLAVVHQGLTKAEAARRYEVSWQWVHTLVTRYNAGGLDALEPRSRRPASNSKATPAAVADRIVELRKQLDADGLDAGPVTIAHHLTLEGIRAPSTATIRRILHAAGLVVANPKKRPRSSLHRFAADQPNECWQSDFTHWPLADGTDTEILNWLDDHSRYLLSITAFVRVGGDDVVNTFTSNVNNYGPPASTLTDNGSVYTSRFTGGRNAFEYLLHLLRIDQKNGRVNHPQTQGKIERFHQTLKKWLAKQPQVATLAELQAQLDIFQRIYNTLRPHRALGGLTPDTAYQATPIAAPRGTRVDEHFRIRLDHVDQHGAVSIRRAGRMHHLGVGARHRATPVLILLDATTATVTHRTTGEILSRHTIDPGRDYWRNTDREPGRWPGPQQ